MLAGDLKITHLALVFSKSETRITRTELQRALQALLGLGLVQKVISDQGESIQENPSAPHGIKRTPVGKREQ